MHIHHDHVAGGHHHHDHDHECHCHDHEHEHDHECHCHDHEHEHDHELAQLAEKLKEAGNPVAFEQVMAAVSDFEKGNMRLSLVLASLK